MNNPLYQQSKIYKIWSPQTDKVYIGSTCTTLPKRLYGHRQHYKQWKKGNHGYVSSYDILECPDHDIELIEEYPCKNKMELHRREGEHIRETECVNKCIPGRTRDEWSVDNAEHVKEQQKKYRENNAEREKERKKIYRKENAEKVKQAHRKYRENNPEHVKKNHKKYRENNPEKVKQAHRKYRENNAEKEKVRHKKYRENNLEKVRQREKQYKKDNDEKLNQKNACECGGKYTNKNKLQHSKTKRHRRHEAAIALTGNNDS